MMLWTEPPTSTWSNVNGSGAGTGASTAATVFSIAASIAPSSVELAAASSPPAMTPVDDPLFATSRAPELPVASLARVSDSSSATASFSATASS